MKQLLLLVAVYSLIINQTGKKMKTKGKAFSPVQVTEQKKSNPPQGRLQAHDFIAPAFSYSTFLIIRSFSPTYTTTKGIPANN